MLVMYQSRLPAHDVVPQCVHPSFWGTFTYAHILSYRATYLRAVMPTRFDLIIENDKSQHDDACAGGACFHGVSNAVVYCTNASRGLSAIAELLVMRPSSLGGAAYCVALCRPSVCLSVRPVIERHVAPPSELQ